MDNDARRQGQAESEDRYALQFALDSDDPEFVRGCEAGYVNAKLRLLGDETLREFMRRSNAEMLRRMAEAAGRTFEVEPIDDEWMSVVIDPVRERA